MQYRFKHLKDFGSYIYEQDMMGGDMTGQAAPAPKDVKYTFIFIEEGDEGSDKYPDGTSSSTYPTYSINKSDLEEWAKTNIKNIGEEKGLKTLDIKKDAVIDYISGNKSAVTPENKEYIISFKNQVKSEQVGEKVGDTEVIFYPEEKSYGTDKVDVTFIIIPKK
jgi:hypothetical protein